MLLFGLGKYIKQDKDRRTRLMQEHDTIKPDILCKK
jgi:hypothetical protein